MQQAELDSALEESDVLAEELLALIDLPLFDDSSRIVISEIACSLSFEHWHASRILLQEGLVSSAMVVQRTQFESILRSIWLTYAASDLDVSKLTATLHPESEQAAKNIAQAQDMMEALEKKGPKEAHVALSRFKTFLWKALNSYAHAGIHPLQRHAEGYPVDLAHGILCNANGLAMLAGMQAVVLSGRQPLQRDVIALAARHPSCMPPAL